MLELHALNQRSLDQKLKSGENVRIFDIFDLTVQKIEFYINEDDISTYF